MKKFWQFEIILFAWGALSIGGYFLTTGLWPENAGRITLAMLFVMTTGILILVSCFRPETDNEKRIVVFHARYNRNTASILPGLLTEIVNNPESRWHEREVSAFYNSQSPVRLKRRYCVFAMFYKGNPIAVIPNGEERKIIIFDETCLKDIFKMVSSNRVRKATNGLQILIELDEQETKKGPDIIM